MAPRFSMSVEITDHSICIAQPTHETRIPRDSLRASESRIRLVLDHTPSHKVDTQQSQITMTLFHMHQRHSKDQQASAHPPHHDAKQESQHQRRPSKSTVPEEDWSHFHRHFHSRKHRNSCENEKLIRKLRHQSWFGST